MAEANRYAYCNRCDASWDLEKADNRSGWLDHHAHGHVGESCEVTLHDEHKGRERFRVTYTEARIVDAFVDGIAEGRRRAAAEAAIPEWQRTPHEPHARK